MTLDESVFADAELKRCDLLEKIRQVVARAQGRKSAEEMEQWTIDRIM